MGRRIIYMNAAAFPIQIERLKDPKLRSYPLVIAPPDERAIIYALSEEARQAGIRRGMSVKSALKYCRDVVILPPNEPVYFRAAAEMNRILGKLSPIIEPVHQGHTFVDVTGTQRLFGGISQIGNRAQEEIKRRLQVDIRLGAATNKLVSQLATYAPASRAIKQVQPGAEAQFIAPFRVYLLPKVTRNVQTQMSDLNINLVRELAAVTILHLTMIFGRFGIQLYNFSHGIDPRPVTPPARTPGIVEIRIFDKDTNDIEILLASLLVLIEKAARQLRQQGLVARKLRLFLRYSDYKEDKAGIKLPAGSSCELEIFPIAKEHFLRILKRRVRVRQIAIKTWDLRPKPVQLSLFDSNQTDKSQKIIRTMDKIRDRFGQDAIRFARTMGIRG